MSGRNRCQPWKRLDALLPAAVCAAWIAALAWLLHGNRYRAFLQPRFWPLLAAALLVLLLFFAALLRMPSGHRRGGAWAGIAVLLVPLAFLYNAYGQNLDAGAFASRAVADEPAAFLPPLDADEPPSVFHPGDTVLLSDLIRRSERYRGKQVTVDGNVYRDRNVPPNNILLYRFLIFCCAADALPVWVVVRTPPGEWETDSWVRVKGRFRFETINNRQVPLIEAETLTPMPPPPPEARYLFF